MIINTSILKQILVALGGDPDYGDNSVDTERKIVNVVGGDGSKYNEGEAQLLKRWLDAIGGTSVYADNEDRTLGKILEQYGGGLGVFLNPTGKLEAILGQLNGVPPVAPTLVSATIGTDGETLTLVFSQSMNGTLGFIETFEVYSLTYSSGEGTNIYTFSVGPTVASSASLTLNYNPGDFVSAENGEPLADIAAFPITNNSVWDADALDFFSRASISDGTQKSATNTLVLDLKAASIWASLRVFYPFVGGTSGTHAVNLKSSSFTITWNGTVTHDSNGITGDGVTGYADTGINASTAEFVDNLSYGAYVRSQGAGNSFIMSSNDGGGNFTGGHVANGGSADWSNGQSSIISISTASLIGLVQSSRTASNNHQAYYNGVNAGSDLINGQGTLPNANWLLLTNFALFQQDANLAAAFISLGLSSGQSSDLYDAVQAFQTTLGRNV